MFRGIYIFGLLLIFFHQAASYTNPVQGYRDSPDPGAIYDGNYYYAATTMGWDGHYFPIWKSSDLFTWSQ